MCIRSRCVAPKPLFEYCIPTWVFSRRRASCPNRRIQRCVCCRNSSSRKHCPIGSRSWMNGGLSRSRSISPCACWRMKFMRFFRNHVPIHPRFAGIIVELNEADALRYSDQLVQLAAQLRKFKIRISADNLASCPPSLANAEPFPFSEIKVGRQFVSGCASDQLARALCRTMVEVAHRFGARAAAVGVETREDLAAVQDVGFDVAQGFFFGRPMPAQELALLTAMRRGGFRGLQTPSASS